MRIHEMPQSFDCLSYEDVTAGSTRLLLLLITCHQSPEHSTGTGSPLLKSLL